MPESITKHFSCLWYLLKHKYYVLKYGLILRVPIYRLIIHDLSKFRPSEWFGYVNYFWVKKKDDSGLDYAWNLHQKRNPHHWQAWFLVNSSDMSKNKALSMPRSYVAEMVADWAGAGMAQKGKLEIADWYLKNKNDITLEEYSRQWAEIYIRDLCWECCRKIPFGF